MDKNVLKSCKKCIVRRIINPSVYVVTEYEKRISYNRQMKVLGFLLAKNVEKVKENEDIQIGATVAFKHKTDFYRGEITDTFTRKNEIIYSVLLTDFGNTVEVPQKNIYFIKNKNLRKKQFNTFEVTIQGIKPSILDVNCENEIFQKRVCKTWSSQAFNFVKDLIARNPVVFVKDLYCHQKKIFGDIYLIQDPTKEIVSLTQLLCNKGFAVFSTTGPEKISNLKGENNTGVEGKIPKNVLFEDVESLEPAQPPAGSYNIRLETKEMSKAVQRAVTVQTNSSYSSSAAEELKDDLTIQKSSKGSGNCYSPSWMLKKCLLRYRLSASSNDSIKKQYFLESQKN